MTGRKLPRRGVGDLRLARVVPDEHLERQVQGRQRRSRHYRRARSGTAEQHQSGIAQVQSRLAGLRTLIDHCEKLQALGADSFREPRDRIGHGSGADLGDNPCLVLAHVVDHRLSSVSFMVTGS
jgi:hypothetical protein